MTLPTLPTYYYLDHFTEMLASVAKTYAAILSDKHHQFITEFHGLPKHAQCLLIRMVNRRGNIFRRSALHYAEIAAINDAFDALSARGYTRLLRAEDYALFLACLPKGALLHGAKCTGAKGFRSNWSKPRLIDWYLAEVEFALAAHHCKGSEFVVLDNLMPLHFLLYLYFGKTEDDLKQFALRDLGIMRTNTSATVSARFSDGEEAYACFHYSRVSATLEGKILSACTSSVDAILNGPPAATDYAADLKGRAACQAGQLFEKRGERDLAIQLYRAGTSPDCNERLVRILYANGDKGSAEELLRRLIDDPASDDEFFFATDFYARKFGGQRTSACTDLLRGGRSVMVDDARRGNPEAGVVGVMRRDGWRVFFAENTVWQSLFGLLFWNELFESGQLHSNFD